MRLAAIDVGTNTALLLVVERAPDGTLTPLHDECRFVRLGQGLDDSGRLARAAIDRGLDAARGYREVLARLEVERVGIVGTQSLREAANAREFIGPAEELLGASLEVISGDREAELTFRATVESFPELARDTLVVADVGGGSTEVIVGSAGRLDHRTSVKVGSVRMTERFLRSDPVAPAEVTAMTEHLDAAFAPLELPAGLSLVGTAGTATTLAAVELRLASYDAAQVHGIRLPSPVVERQLARYLELSVADRRALPGLEPARADVIAAGAAIFARLLHRMDAPELIVSDRGVRWGVAYELADNS